MKLALLLIKTRTHFHKQSQDGQVIGMPQSKVSKMLRGQFRGISEAMMLECLTRLGLDVQIVIGADSHSTTPGRVSVVAA